MREHASDSRLVIEPGGQSLLSYISEAWRYRELFFFLTWRDITVKYKQTVLGVAWIVFQPLVSTLVFTLIFNRLAHIPSDNTPYPIFVLAAIIPWNFFAGSLGRSGESLVGSATLITKVYFPRIIIPAAAAMAGAMDFLVSLLVFFGLMIYYRIAPGLEVLALPLLMVLPFFIATSFGLMFSALNVRYRDVKFVIGFVIQIWMYLTPVVYPLSLIPERYQTIALLNPMVGVIEAFRWALLGRPFPGIALAFSCAIGVAMFVIAFGYFRGVERTFADVV